MIIDQLFTRPIFEAADPSRLIATITLAKEFNADEPTKEIDLTGRFQGDVKSQMNQAADYLTQFLQSKGFNFTSIQLKYQGMVMNRQNRGAMAPQSDWEKEAEATANQMRAKRSVQNTAPALKEFAPSDDDSNGSDSEEMLRRMAAHWWNGTEKQMAKVENTLAAMGWEIGQDDGYDDGGVFVVRAGDEHGRSYLSWPHEELDMNEGMDEGRKKKKTSRSLGRYFFPGFGYYGSGDAGEGGGDGGGGESAMPGMAEGSDQQLSVRQLATISDEALDKAYGYGRSSPGNTFGWQANLKSAAYAKHMIDKGVTDIDEIADAIHKGWNVTAKAFVKNPNRFDDTEKLKAAGKLEAKLQQRAKLMNIDYSQLPDDEQEKDRVVARALLQAITGGGEQDIAEGEYDSRKPFGVRYKVFAGREGRMTTREYWTSSEEKLQRAVDKIQALDNFYEIDGYSYPKESQGVAKGLDPNREAAKTLQNLKNLALMKSALTSQQLRQAGRESMLTDAINACIQYEQSYLQNKQQGNAIFVRALRDEIDNFRKGYPINSSMPEDNAPELGDLLQGKLGKINFQQGVAEGRQIDEMFADQGSGSTDRDNADYMKRRNAAKKKGYTGRETKDGTWRVFKDGNAVAVAGPFKSADEAAAWIKKHKQGITEMDKSEPSAGRDTGPREGPEKIAKPISKEKMTKDALDALSKSMAKKDDKKKDVKESDALMKKLQRAMVREGRVKELALDLKTMPDADFMKKYGKAKAAIRADMKRVDEAGISRLGKKDIEPEFDFRTGLGGDDETGYETQNEPELGMFRMGKPVEPNDAATKEFMAAFQGAGQQNADNSRPLEPGEFRTNDGRIFRFVTDPARYGSDTTISGTGTPDWRSIAAAGKPAAASGLPKMRFDIASQRLVPVDQPVALDMSPKTKDIKSGSNPNIDAATRDRARAYAAQQNAPAAAAKQKVDWKTIYALNKATIGSNPNIIKPRMQLNMPNGTIYLVQPGDTLTKIAAKQSQIMSEAPKSAAVRLGNAIKRVQGTTAASQARSVIPSSIPRPEPKKDEKEEKEAKKVDESRAARRALMARIVNSG